ncbi:hypothetical protein A3740_13765, partial [Oleiphilus sp. HI0068]
MNFSKLIYISLLLSLFSSFSNAITQTSIRYPQPGEVFTKHHSYPIELLKLALSYHSVPLTVEPSQYFMTQGRAIKQLSQSKGIDVMWTMTSKERESEVKPIRIPIYKGLIGWRLFLTTPEQLATRKQSQDLRALKKATLIQGHDWPDTNILRYNNFKVQTGPSYEGLFQVLSLNRAELFPRSIIEIWDELETHQHRNITLEPHTLLSYPTATYFFVAQENTALASLIEEGLQKALLDGKFDALFQQYYADLILKANLKQRLHYRLINPLL